MKPSQPADRIAGFSLRSCVLYSTLGAAIVLLAACGRSEDAAPETANVQEQAGALHHDDHEHMEHGPVPELLPGERWSTDAALRTAMTNIRDSVQAAVSARSQGALQAADAVALADEVEKNVRYMIENCQLEPEPDAALHVLIARMVQAAGTLRTDPASQNGVPQLVSVLREYGATFDHPGWADIEHAGH